MQITAYTLLALKYTQIRMYAPPLFSCGAQEKSDSATVLPMVNAHILP